MEEVSDKDCEEIVQVPSKNRVEGNRRRFKLSVQKSGCGYKKLQGRLSVCSDYCTPEVTPKVRATAPELCQTSRRHWLGWHQLYLEQLNSPSQWPANSLHAATPSYSHWPPGLEINLKKSLLTSERKRTKKILKKRGVRMDIKLSKRQACFRLEQNSAFKPHCTTGCDAGTRLPRLSASIRLWGNSHNSSPAFPGQVTLRRLVTAGWDACVGNWRNDRDAGLFNVKPDCFHEFEWLVGFFPLQHHRRFLEKNSRNTDTGA